MILANSPQRPHSDAKPQRDIESGIEEINDASSRTTPELRNRDKQQQQQSQVDASQSLECYISINAKDQVYSNNEQEEKFKQNQQNTTMTTLMMIHPNIVIENHKEIEIENGHLKMSTGNYQQSSQKRKSKEQLEENDPQKISQHVHNIIKPFPSKIQSAKILTYNIFLRPPLIKNNLDDYKNERTKMILNVINRFDVICFQELFGFLNQRKHKIIYNAMKQGFYYHAQSPSPSFFSSYLVDGGLVTLSRFPIVAKCFKPFKYGVMSDNLSQKGVLYTKIQMKEQQQNTQISRKQEDNQMKQPYERNSKTNKKKSDLRNNIDSDDNDEQGPFIHLFNTHLQASYIGKESNIKATVITRIDQLLFMKEFIHEQVKKHRTNPDDLILICGDFNVNARGHNHPLHYLKEFTDLYSLMEAIHPTEFCEYNLLKTILSENSKFPLTDTLKARFNGESPVTYADSFFDPQTDKELPLEVALTIEEDLLLKSCIDYIIDLKIPCESPKNTSFSDSIKLNPKTGTSSTLSVDIPNVSVEKFFVENQLFTQLSDHYGVSATLIVNSSAKSELICLESGCGTVQQQMQQTTEKESIQIINAQSKQTQEVKHQDSNHFNGENQQSPQFHPSHTQKNGTASSQKPSIYPNLKYQAFD